MTVQNSPTPAAVTVTEMAEMCRLSRSRFYSLVADGIFPPPVQQESRKRPVYVRDVIEKCLEIRRTGVGFDGRLITFNRKRKQPVKTTPSRRKTAAPAAENGRYGELVTGLRSLGLVDFSESQVSKAIEELYPSGIEGVDPGEVIRKVFLALKQQ